MLFGGIVFALALATRQADAACSCECVNGSVQALCSSSRAYLPPSDLPDCTPGGGADPETDDTAVRHDELRSATGLQSRYDALRVPDDLPVNLEDFGVLQLSPGAIERYSAEALPSMVSRAGVVSVSRGSH
jgi:hypothetical protein